MPEVPGVGALVSSPLLTSYTPPHLGSLTALADSAAAPSFPFPSMRALDERTYRKQAGDFTGLIMQNLLEPTGCGAVEEERVQEGS